MSFHKSLKTAVLPALVLAFAPLASGCATFGVLYEDVGHPPIDVGGSPNSPGISWDRNLNASMGGRELTKKGVACSQDILKLVAWGDATQAAAAKQGGVTQVVGVDFHNSAILGFIYTQNCTVVYGNDAAPAATDIPATDVSAPPPDAAEDALAEPPPDEDAAEPAVAPEAE